MADYSAPIEKIRPEDLDLYLFASDPDYKDPTTVCVVLSHPDWPIPKMCHLSDIPSAGGSEPTIHKEADVLSGLSSTIIDITFDTPFDQVPIGRKNLYCYKVDGNYDSNLLIKDVAITASGFTCEIEDVSGVAITDFTGIYFEYCFFERS